MNISLPDLAMLRWAIPPIVGAVIGYVTNVIAIKMLFRPLNEKRILGLRIPLTPGIIPRQRHSLAESIGVMVSRDLITEDAVRNQLASPAFSSTVRSKFTVLMDLLLYTPTKKLPHRLRLPEIKREEVESPRTSASESLINELLVDFFHSDAFSSSIRKTVAYSVDSLCRLPVHRLFGKKGERLRSFVSKERMARLREPAKLNFRMWLRNQISSDRRFSSLLTPQIIDGMANVLDHLYPSLFEALLEYLRSPRVHHKLELRGKVVLRRILEKLSNFQRFFVVAGQYDRTLDERMDVVIDDVIMQLEHAGWDYETRKRLIDTLRQWLRGVSGKSASELERAWRGDMVEDLSGALDSLFDWLSSDRGIEVLHGILESLFRRVSEEEIGTAMYRVLGIETSWVSSRLAEWISGMLGTEVETGTDKESKVWSFLQSMAGEISSNGEKSVAEIVGIGGEDKERIEAEASRFFLRVLNEQIPLILESVDVQTLVVDKIDTLDILKVEDLILQVIRSHLRWISAFGAVLGFFIGSIQLFIFFFS